MYNEISQRLQCDDAASGFTCQCFCTISANINTVKKANNILSLL